jgi:hypothetical protein
MDEVLDYREADGGEQGINTHRRRGGYELFGGLPRR